MPDIDFESEDTQAGEISPWLPPAGLPGTFVTHPCQNCRLLIEGEIEHSGSWLCTSCGVIDKMRRMEERLVGALEAKSRADGHRIDAIGQLEVERGDFQRRRDQLIQDFNAKSLEEASQRARADIAEQRLARVLEAAQHLAKLARLQYVERTSEDPDKRALWAAIAVIEAGGASGEPEPLYPDAAPPGGDADLSATFSAWADTQRPFLGGLQSSDAAPPFVPTEAPAVQLQRSCKKCGEPSSSLEWRTCPDGSPHDFGDAT